jgi:hypothetical protein
MPWALRSREARLACKRSESDDARPKKGRDPVSSQRRPRFRSPQSRTTQHNTCYQTLEKRRVLEPCGRFARRVFGPCPTGPGFSRPVRSRRSARRRARRQRKFSVGVGGVRRERLRPATGCQDAPDREVPGRPTAAIKGFSLAANGVVQGVGRALCGPVVRLELR